MSHDNITEQIGALAEDLQMTKEALMGKLEVHLDTPLVLSLQSFCKLIFISQSYQENSETLQEVEEILNQTNSGDIDSLFDSGMEISHPY